MGIIYLTPQQFSANLTSNYGNEYYKIEFALILLVAGETSPNFCRVKGISP